METVVAFLAAAGATGFAIDLGRDAVRRPRPHVVAYAVGMVMFAVATVALALALAFGWSDLLYKVFFLFGAVLNILYLALGSVYLVIGPRAGRVFQAILAVFTVFSLVVVISATVESLPAEGIPRASDSFEIGIPVALAAIGGGIGASILIALGIVSIFRFWRKNRRLVWGNALIVAGVMAAAFGGTLLAVLGEGGGLAVALLAAALLIWSGYRIAAGASRRTGGGLKTITEDPPNREVSLAELVSGGPFYVRSNFPLPSVEAATWTLTVRGAVSLPQSWSLEELRQFPYEEVPITLECAGNGRTLMEPVPEGTPWGLGAVGTARFGGTRLRHVLDEVEPGPSVEEWVLTGADRGRVEPEGDIHYEFGLRASEADRAVLAWEMNGREMLPEHGYPLRAVVPGQYGMKSVKWLTSVTAIETRFEGHFPLKYRYFGDPAAGDGEPVSNIRVRSIITQPPSGARVRMGKVTVAGLAWSGNGSITTVEVGVNSEPSRQARLGQPEGPHAAVPWEWEFDPPEPGRYQIFAMAGDSAGHVQPRKPLWNENGYGNNVVHEIAITFK